MFLAFCARLSEDRNPSRWHQIKVIRAQLRRLPSQPIRGASRDSVRVTGNRKLFSSFRAALKPYGPSESCA
jgi:hypothetical protein